MIRNYGHVLDLETVPGYRLCGGMSLQTFPCDKGLRERAAYDGGGLRTDFKRI